MSLPVVIRPEATHDADGMRSFLEEQRPGLGQTFLNRLNECLARVGFMPEMYGVVWKNVRAVRFRRFMYVAYYRVHDDPVEILAIKHGSQDEQAWQSRV